jgi:hypothetical protein
MLMTVFGAGASYDSIPSRRPHPSSRVARQSYGAALVAEEYRLPLANELFDDRPKFVQAIQQFPKCQAVIPYLREPPPGKTVENVLEALQTEAPDYPERMRQLAAIRYYLHFMLWNCGRDWEAASGGDTNYKTLLDQIQRWRKPGDQVCLVTFNYDGMLENALPSVGLNIRELRDYITSEEYKIIKPHGSVNWAREVKTPVKDLQNRNTWQVAYELIDRAPELDISQKYCMVNEHPIGKSGEQVLFPALAIPVETKQNYECPEEHFSVLCEQLRKVGKLLLIGWRAMEDHFLKLLRDNLPSGIRGMVVAGNKDEANNTIKNIADAGIKGDFLPTNGGFSDFVVRREGEDLLKS